MAKTEEQLTQMSLEDKPGSLVSEGDISASQLFASSFAEALVPADQLAAMVAIQQRMLARFERTNALLSTAIDVSNRRLLPPGAPQQMLSFQSGLLDRIPNTDVVQDIRRASVQLGELRERLLNVTRRVRNLKTKCARLFPQAFDECEKSLGLMALNSQLNLADDGDGEVVLSAKQSTSDDNNNSNNNGNKSATSDSSAEKKPSVSDSKDPKVSESSEQAVSSG